MTIPYEYVGALVAIGALIGIALGFFIFSGVTVVSTLDRELRMTRTSLSEDMADEVHNAVVLSSAFRAERQNAVHLWCIQNFGADHAASVPQRALRTLEETLELCQASGLNEHQASRCVTYVYGRPPGDPAKELAQVGVVLLSVAAALGIDADAVEAAEVHRIMSLPKEHWQKRNAEKDAAGLRVEVAPVTPPCAVCGNTSGICPRLEPEYDRCPRRAIAGAEK